ncbi:MAG: pyridoxal phosphate-dependent aminotransferase [Clostridia bacterium]|nr:pyridoxal phosphate-dependent aminotransferase [Clostridia bacterium]
MTELNRAMIDLGSRRSAIREIFEYGRKRAAEIGEENVFDFSIGNPNVPPPPELGAEIARLAEEADPVRLHSYTSAQGSPEARRAIAEDLRGRFGVRVTENDLYLTCGAAASVAIVLRALAEPGRGDEVVVFAPFFPEYRVFAESAGAVLKVVPADTETFGIRVSDAEPLIGPRTRAVLLNVPNNPTGVVPPLEDVKALCRLLERASERYGHPIYLISDEPYRELLYDESKALPFLTTLYRNTVVCYSFSKSMSIPGERFGYVLVPPEAEEHDLLYAAVCGAGRALGYVCAPSLMEQSVPAALGLPVNLEVYRTNRGLLFRNLTAFGFRCVPPDGAFYLFMQSPEPDADAFCRRARDYEILMVPSDSFGCPGFVRISYCVKTETILRSLPAFRLLAQSYGLSEQNP